MAKRPPTIFHFDKKWREKGLIFLFFCIFHFSLNNQRKKLKPKYRGMWSENDSYTEVLISKRMVEDHMPDKVLEALTQVKSKIY